MLSELWGGLRELLVRGVLSMGLEGRGDSWLVGWDEVGVLGLGEGRGGGWGECCF